MVCPIKISPGSLTKQYESKEASQTLGVIKEKNKGQLLLWSSAVPWFPNSWSAGKFWAISTTAFGLKEVQRRGEWWLRERVPCEQCWTVVRCFSLILKEKKTAAAIVSGRQSFVGVYRALSPPAQEPGSIR